MKATEIIAKFKEVLLSAVTPEVKEEVLLEEVSQDETIEVSQEDNVETLELNEEVEAIEVTEEEVISEEVSEEVIEEEVELSEEVVSEETEVELAEEAPVEEAPVVEAVKEEYASKEDLGKLSAEISALADLLNNMNPKKDVPQQLSAEEIEVKETVEAEVEVIAVSPEAEVKANFNHLNVPTNKGNSTKNIVWNKLFS